MQALFGVGQALLALIGYYVADWRYISMILAIPTATGFFIPCILDESSRWLISKKRINEADTVLHKIAAQNGNRFQGTVISKLAYKTCMMRMIDDHLKDLHIIRSRKKVVMKTENKLKTPV